MFNPTISGTILTTYLQDGALVADITLENGVLLTAVPFLGQGVGFLPPSAGEDVLLLYQGNSLPYIIGLTNGGNTPLLRETDEAATSSDQDYSPGHYKDLVIQKAGSSISLGEKGGVTIESGQHIRLQLPASSFLRISSSEAAGERLLNAQEFIDPLFALLTQMAAKIAALEAALVAGQTGIAPPDPVQATAFGAAMTALTALPNLDTASAQTSCEAAKNPVIKVPSN